MEVEVLGVRVNYQTIGDGRPIVMLHGGGTDHRLMTTAFDPAFDGREGWRRIYPDLPGMGRTQAADWITGQDDMLAVVEGFVDAVSPGERIALCGASYGAYLGLGYVHRRPEKLDGLALIAPAIRRARDETGLPAHQVFVPADESLVASLAEDERGWLGRSVVQTAENLDFFRTSVLPGVRIADVAFLDRLETGPGLTVDTAAPLAAPFPGPTLILAGRQDNVVGWADALPLLDSFPRATFAVLDRAGHGVRAEQRELFRALFEEWLDRLELEAPRELEPPRGPR